MKSKILYYVSILITLLCVDSCKTKPQAKVVQNSNNIKTQIPKYKYKEPYTYKKPAREHVAIQGFEKGNKILNETDILFVSTNEALVAKPKLQFPPVDLPPSSKINRRKNQRMASNNSNKNNTIAADIFATIGLVLGLFLGLYGFFAGIAVIFISLLFGGAGALALLGLLIMALGAGIFVTSILLYTKYRKNRNQKNIEKLRRESELRDQARRKEVMNDVEEIKSTEPQKSNMETFEDKMRDLKKMHDEKIITDEEYKELKMKTMEEYK